MPRPLRLGLAAILLVVSALAAIILVRLHTASPLERTPAQIADGARPRLAFLRQALDDGAGHDMQALFPEGYFFSHVLYGLSWLDVGAWSAEAKDEALAEARWALAHLDSAEGTAVFSAQLDPHYGVFYAGWILWLRAGIAQLAGPGAPELTHVAADGQELAAAFTRKLEETGSPFLTAYPGQAWPCDSTVGIAAVKLAGLVTGTDYAALVSRWLAAANTRRDPETGLLPHTASPVSGQPTSGARATSQVIILRFLPEVDSERASADWVTFRERFASTVPGLPGIREYPQGTDAGGDVDSGPLVFGLSASASAVALGDAVLYQDTQAASALTGLAEAAGMPFEIAGKRRYLAGQLPIADAFLTWSYTARPVMTGGRASSGPSWSWRFSWYLISSLVFIPMWTVLFVGWRRRRAVPNGSSGPYQAARPTMVPPSS